MACYGAAAPRLQAESRMTKKIGRGANRTDNARAGPIQESETVGPAATGRDCLWAGVVGHPDLGRCLFGLEYLPDPSLQAYRAPWPMDHSWTWAGREEQAG